MEFSEALLFFRDHFKKIRTIPTANVWTRPCYALFAFGATNARINDAIAQTTIVLHAHIMYWSAITLKIKKKKIRLESTLCGKSTLITRRRPDLHPCLVIFTYSNGRRGVIAVDILFTAKLFVRSRRSDGLWKSLEKQRTLKNTRRKKKTQ